MYVKDCREREMVVESIHEDAKSRWDRLPPSRRSVRYRDGFDGKVYVYLIQDGVHIQTLSARLPDRWQEDGCSDLAMARFVRRLAGIQGTRVRAEQS
jgi:hypothetical protein